MEQPRRIIRDEEIGYASLVCILQHHGFGREHRGYGYVLQYCLEVLAYHC